jgi:hypothetical protein
MDLLTVDSGVATGRAGGEPPTRESRWTEARESSPSPLPAPAPSRPLSPSTSARTRDELECREIHGASSAFRRRRLPDAEPKVPPWLGLACGADSGRERPSSRLGRPRAPRVAACPRLPPKWEPPVSALTRLAGRTGSAASSSEEPSADSRRPRTRDAIRAARTLYSTARVVGVATDSDPSPPLDGDHDRRSIMAENHGCSHQGAHCGDVRHGAARCSERFRFGPARRQSVFESARTHRLSPAFAPKTALGSLRQAARRCRHPLAVLAWLALRNTSHQEPRRRLQPEGRPRLREPRGGRLTPDCRLSTTPGRLLRYAHRRGDARPSVPLTITSTDVAASFGDTKRYRRRSETHQLRTRPSTLVRSQMASNSTRWMHPGNRRLLPTGLRGRSGRRAWRIRRSNDTPARYPQTTGTDPDRLSWGFVPYDACRNRQRPTPGLPPPAVLRLQAFSAS